MIGGSQRLADGGGAGPATASRRGMTLVELLMGLAITGMVGAAVAAMLMSTSAATSEQSSVRDLTVSQSVIARRLESAIRNSRQVLAKGDDYLLLWSDDGSRSDAPSVSQLRLVRHDAASHQLVSYTASDALSADAASAPLNLATTDFAAAAATMVANGTLAGQPLAADVAACTISLDKPTPAQARFVRYEIAVAADGQSRTIIGAAALRN